MPGAGVLLEVSEMTFTVAFVMELGLRVAAMRTQFICSFWNWLDTVIVSMALLDTFAVRTIGLNPTVIRLLRLGRLTRLLRILRVANRFDSLFLLLRSIRSSFGILWWSVSLLLIVQTISGMIFSQSLRDIIRDESFSEDVRRQVFLYWGTFSRTMLTMFEITIGNWVPSCRLLVDNVDEGNTLF